MEGQAVCGGGAIKHDRGGFVLTEGGTGARCCREGRWGVGGVERRWVVAVEDPWSL